MTIAGTIARTIGRTIAGPSPVGEVFRNIVRSCLTLYAARSCQVLPDTGLGEVGMIEAAQRRCSFCGKPDQDVRKMIAGPGVYICDGCVETCEGILAAEGTGPAPQIPVWESMTDEEVLAHLPRIAATGSQVEADLRAWVTRLRGRGVTWVRIGAALSMTRQSAWERFSAGDGTPGPAA
jgi:hypothetical protein